MLVAYADESGHSSQDSYVSMAACAAERHVWSIFDERWRSALNDANAPYLHMREFAHRVGAFKGWTEGQRRRFMGLCLEALADLEILMAAAVLKTADYRSLTPEQQTEFVDPLFCCFQECLNALDVSGYRYPHARTAVIYSRQDEYGGNMLRMLRFLKERTGLAQRLSGLEFQDMRQVPGLQLADLVAYELRHYYYRLETSPGTATRYPLQAICDHQAKAGVALFKYIPKWALAIQAAGAWATVQEVLWSLAPDWEHMLAEQIPDCVGLKATLHRQAVTNRRGGLMRELARYRGLRPHP